MTVLETDSVKPLMLVLLDPELPEIGNEQLSMALNVIESYLIRRVIMSATTKNYNIVFTLLIAELRKYGRENAGTVISDFLKAQTADFRYWPDDEQIRAELLSMPIFRKGRRLRMLLEATEDHRRGLTHQPKNSTGEQRVVRGKLTLEHALPQSWEDNWPLEKEETEQTRRSAVHVLGNMTLLTQKLNSKVSNSAWLGTEGKCAALREQSTLLLNRDLTENPTVQWTTEAILERTKKLTEVIIDIWGTPAGHKVVIKLRDGRKKKTVSVSDLLSAGLLEPGTIMRSTWTSLVKRYGTILADGKIETDDGVIFNSLSGSGRHLATVGAVGGWHFWSIGEGEDKRLLDDIRNEYRERFEIEPDTTDDLTESDE
jgi:hypothetical protein